MQFPGRVARFLIFRKFRLPDFQEARGARPGFDNPYHVMLIRLIKYKWRRYQKNETGGKGKLIPKGNKRARQIKGDEA